MIERGLRDVRPIIDAMPAEQAAIAHELATTLFMSFYVTETNAESQEHILKLCGQHYRDTMTPAERAALPDTARRLQPQLADILLPTNHGQPFIPVKGVKPPRRRDIVGGNFNQFFTGLLDAVQTDAPLEPAERKRLAGDAVWGMLENDTDYVIGGRPNPELRPDPHNSIFRSYVLLGEPTGSASLDAVRGELFEATFTGSANPGRLQILERAWHDMHPGEVFYAGERPAYSDATPRATAPVGVVAMSGAGVPVNPWLTPAAREIA